MFGHLMKLIWKRKSRNMMLSLEILLAFVIVFAIAAFGLRFYQLYQLPIGFDYRDVWSVNIRTGPEAKKEFDAELYDKFKRGLESLPGVKQVAFASRSPYMMGGWRTDLKLPGGGPNVSTYMMEASDDWFAVASMRLEEGRWFDRSDDGADTIPVVINRRMARAAFGTAPPLGRQIDFNRRGGHSPMLKVVGVVEDFRNAGELATPVNFTIKRFIPHQADNALRTIMLKMEPGTARTFEAALNRQLKLIRSDWSYEISPLTALRASLLKNQLMPLVVVFVIAAFLLAMVGFGLFGVLWQNTTRRIPEIGLRRAVGASAGQIYRQIIAEQLLLSSGAMVVALALLVQLPLTGALGESLNWSVFLAATALSMAVIYLISLLCSVYPGWRASRLNPTEALHYE